MMHFEAIILGLGGAGSAALRAFAARGIRTAGFDRFTPPHDRGSSHGQTRIFRKAYFEHPDYVPLAITAERLWSELSTEINQPLFRRSGLVQFGPADGPVVRGVLNAAERHSLPVKTFSPAEARRRWPMFSGEELSAVFEPDAGFLFVEQCVAAQLKVAQDAGAEVTTGVAVDWRRNGKLIEVFGSGVQATCDRLVLAAGPWAGSLLGELGVPLIVRRKTVLWRPAAPSMHVDRQCPCYLFELPQGVFYGFPALDEAGVKVGEHSGGQIVDDPLHVDRELSAADAARVDEFVARCLPQASGPAQRHSVCMYTMSPDEHFLLDRLPDHPQVVLAAGLSGHGFKFAPVLGEALADLALDGGSDLPIGFLALKRFDKPGASSTAFSDC